jgi:hypothetical protein
MVAMSCSRPPRAWQTSTSTLRPPIPLVRYTLDLPSLIPTDTRAYETNVKEGAHGAEDAFDETMVYFWTSVCSFIVGLATIMRNDAVALAWYRAQWASDYPRLSKLRSVGQHYGMETGLLDATASIPVAFWFATHEFASGAYRADDSGVIYRIDRTCLSEVERWIERLPEHEGQFDARSIDIGDTPESIAPRAIRQCGWSLVGWDHPRLMIRMVAEGGLTKYVFRTGAVASEANPLRHEFLVPPADPARRLFERFWISSPRSIADAQTWIDRHWNPATERPIRIAADGDWLSDLTAEMGRIVGYHAEALSSGSGNTG